MSEVMYSLPNLYTIVQSYDILASEIPMKGLNGAWKYLGIMAWARISEVLVRQLWDDDLEG